MTHNWDFILATEILYLTVRLYILQLWPFLITAISPNCDFIFCNVTLYLTLWLEISQLQLYISHCDFVSKFRPCFPITRTLYLTLRQLQFYISKCKFISQNATFYLTIRLYISKRNFIYISKYDNLKMQLFISHYDFKFHNCNFVSDNSDFVSKLRPCFLHLKMQLFISQCDNLAVMTLSLIIVPFYLQMGLYFLF